MIWCVTWKKNIKRHLTYFLECIRECSHKYSKDSKSLCHLFAPGKTITYRKRKHNHGSLFNSQVSLYMCVCVHICTCIHIIMYNKNLQYKYIHNNLNTDCWFYQKWCNYIGGVWAREEVNCSVMILGSEMLILHWFQNMKSKKNRKKKKELAWDSSFHWKAGPGR